MRSLKNAGFKVETREDAARLPNIGTRILVKITEILETGTLQRAEVEKEDARLTVMQMFSNVWGSL